jgi:type II secretory pathway predicted ATPase ExeA
MIRSFFGIDDNPFSERSIRLRPQQQEIFDALKVHSQQGGLCMVLGIPGTGKSVIKGMIEASTDKQKAVNALGRTLHTYCNTVKILCQRFGIEDTGHLFACERRLIDEAVGLNRLGKLLITVIDDAHLMDMTTLRKLRLLFEDFPKNHNLILFGQPELMSHLSLTVNADIKSRVTFSAVTRRLHQDDIENFILSELDRICLAHSTFTEGAFQLIIRSADGVLRRARNLCLASLLEAVRDRTKSIDIDIVNRVLLQPHLRNECDLTDF